MDSPTSNLKRHTMLWDRYLNNDGGVDRPIPGGQITRQELDDAERNSPIKGQLLDTGPLPCSVSPSPPTPVRRRRRGLLRTLVRRLLSGQIKKRHV